MSDQKDKTPYDHLTSTTINGISLADAFINGKKIGKDEATQTIIDAMNSYSDGKISLERCSEIIGINIYELIDFCRKWSTTLSSAIDGD